MSYLDHAQDPRRRAAAFTGTLAIHVALGLALVVGLTITGLGPEEDAWDPFTITPDPQPKPPPDPEPRQRSQDSVVTVPPAPFDLHPVDPPLEPVEQDRPSDEVAVLPDPGPTTRPDPPRPAFAPRRAVPINDASRWITTDDYPRRPLVDEIEGTGAYRLVVGTNGRVSACDVTRSTGNGQLDAATCRFIAQRARFEAATDETGASVIGSYTGTVRWEIPD